MRFLIDNAAARATITTTNDTLNYNPVNLVNTLLRKRWQPLSGTSNVITVTFDTAENVNCFFFGYHNADSISVELFDGGGSLESQTMDPASYQTDALYFTQTYSVTYAEITVNKSSGTMYLGGIALGVYFGMPGQSWGYQHGYSDNSLSAESPYGQSLQNYIPALQKAPITFPAVTESEVALIKDALYPVGVGGKIWVDFYPGAHSQRHPEYCKIVSIGDFIRQEGTFSQTYSFKLDLLEAR